MDVALAGTGPSARPAHGRCPCAPGSWAVSSSGDVLIDLCAACDLHYPELRKEVFFLVAKHRVP